MSVMLYKKSEGKSPYKVKVRGVEYDYIVVDPESAPASIKKGWMDSPGATVVVPKKEAEEVVEAVTVEPVEIDVDNDGLIDGSDEKEELRDEYALKSGKKPDGRWNIAKLKEKIAEL